MLDYARVIGETLKSNKKRPLGEFYRLLNLLAHAASVLRAAKPEDHIVRPEFELTVCKTYLGGCTVITETGHTFYKKTTKIAKSTKIAAYYLRLVEQMIKCGIEISSDIQFIESWINSMFLKPDQIVNFIDSIIFEGIKLKENKLLELLIEKFIQTLKRPEYTFSYYYRTEVYQLIKSLLSINYIDGVQLIYDELIRYLNSHHEFNNYTKALSPQAEELHCTIKNAILADGKHVDALTKIINFPLQNKNHINLENYELSIREKLTIPTLFRETETTLTDLQTKLDNNDRYALVLTFFDNLLLKESKDLSAKHSILFNYAFALSWLYMEGCDSVRLQPYTEAYEKEVHNLPYDSSNRDTYRFGYNHLQFIRKLMGYPYNDRRVVGSPDRRLVDSPETDHYLACTLLDVHAVWPTLPPTPHPRLPFVLLNRLHAFTENKKIDDFITCYENASSTGDKKTFEFFVMQNIVILSMLMNVMKYDAFCFMQRLMDNNYDKLIAFIEGLNPVSEKINDAVRNLFTRFKSDMLNTQISEFEILLLAIHETFMAVNSLAVSKEHNLSDLDITITNNFEDDLLKESKQCKSIINFREYLHIYMANHITHYLLDGAEQKKARKFIMHFYALNTQTRIDGKIDLVDFFEEKKRIIKQLAAIMGEEAFTFLQKMSVNSNAALCRYLDNFALLSDQQIAAATTLFNRFKKQIMQDDTHYQTFKNIILTLSAFRFLVTQPADMLYQDESKECADMLKDANTENEFLTKFPSCESLKKCHENLGYLLCEFTLDRMQLPIPAINPSYLFEKMPIQLIPKLIHARNKMRNQEYGEVFDEMLTADLSSELGFAHFAMASPDGSEIAQKLTRHNQSILTDLTSAGIDVQQAMYYDKKIYFQYAGGGVVDLNQQISSIWTSFTLTKQRITGLDLELKKLLNFPEEYPKELSVLGKEVNDLSAMMDNFEKRLLSNKNTDFVYEAVKTALIKDVSLKVHIDKISRKIDRIQACLPNEILPISTLSGSEAQLKKEQRYFIKIRDALIPFYTIKSTVAEQLKRIIEQGNHFTNYYNRLESDSSRVRNAQKVLSTKTRYFRVERWDKNKLLTFFLGDMLSCCLASDGAYFEAMVQRRMDIAMFMDVVIDERTGLPVCGNWLFWGEDIYKPDDIYVVANFFEINAGIASNQQLNKTLVDHLLYFTGDFSKNVGAKGLIIRPLTYGQIPDFQQFREEKEIKIKKIGGCLDESEVELLLESLDDSALLLKNIQRMAKNVIDKTNEFMLKVPSCSTVEKLRETLSELNAKIAALNNVVLEIPAQEIMLAKQKTILNHYNQFKKCVHQLKQQLLELSTLDDYKQIALLLNKIIQPSITLIEAHEENNNAAVINHYYLESLKLQHFYYYDVAAMEQSEVFNPSCQRDTEVEIAVNANQNGLTRA